MKFISLIFYISLTACHNAEADLNAIVETPKVSIQATKSVWSASPSLNSSKRNRYQVVCTSANTTLKCWSGDSSGHSPFNPFVIPPAIARLGLNYPRIVGNEALLCGEWQQKEVCFPNVLNYGLMKFYPGVYMNQQINNSDWYQIGALRPNSVWNLNSVSFDFTSADANWPYVQFKVPLDSLEWDSFGYFNDGKQFYVFSVDNFFYVPDDFINYYWGSMRVNTFDYAPTPNAAISAYPCWIDNNKNFFCENPGAGPQKIAEGVDQLAKIVLGSNFETLFRFHRSDGWHLTQIGPNYDVLLSLSDVQDIVGRTNLPPWYIPYELAQTVLTKEYQFCSLDSAKMVHCWGYDWTVDALPSPKTVSTRLVTLHTPNLSSVDKLLVIQDKFCAVHGNDLVCWEYQSSGDPAQTTFTNDPNPVMIDMKVLLP